MSYDSTTGVPRNDGQKTIFKQHEFTNADSFPRPVWIPPDYKRAIIDDVVISLWEKSTKRAFFSLQLYVNGGWEDIISIGTVGGNDFQTVKHGFMGKLISDGSGSPGAARVRMRKWSASQTTDFTIKILVIGRHV